MNSPWSVNRLAGQALALHGSLEPHFPNDPGCRHCAEALELMRAAGVLPRTGRTVLPDDNRTLEVIPIDEASQMDRRPMNARDPSLDRSTLPPGLAAFDPSVEPVESRPPQKRRRAVCGTLSGRSRHVRRGEQPCRACKDAANAHKRATRAAKVTGQQPAKSKRDDGSKCGTLTGLSRHRLRREKPCPACREAASEHKRATRQAQAAARQPKPTPTPKPVRVKKYPFKVNPDLPPRPDTCGTPAGRSNHLRRGEKPCRPCLEAFNAQQRDAYRRRRAQAAARQIAEPVQQVPGQLDLYHGRERSA